jgi:hypothetical protein
VLAVAAGQAWMLLLLLSPRPAAAGALGSLAAPRAAQRLWTERQFLDLLAGWRL